MPRPIVVPARDAKAPRAFFLKCFEVVWIFWTDIRVQTMQCGHVLHKMLFTKKTANLDAFNSHLHIIFQR
ncbi:hypothetical protein, partial [Sutterella wadsworthensis]|uniref:hypothetical protein n=1 Tax=Sutterella wadsworthensis TaxID=40545 RepID=UPI00242FCF0A